jgi:3-hydroxy-9,10-secoandrosta-1,3,5(10)-triene-9,17-dione monooxygenase reductase component
MNQTQGRFTGDDLRDVMRNVASPVTVVTFCDSQGPRGITIGSFTSVSLEPPLVSFNVSKDSAAHDALISADRINVNVLSEDQAGLASHFSLSGMSPDQQFEPVVSSLDEDGLPVLGGVVSTLFCRVIASAEAGDSTIVIAQVKDALQPGDQRPVLYFQQEYHSVGEIKSPSVDATTNRLSSSTP